MVADRAGASTIRVLILPKMINMNILETLYSSTDFPALVLVCSVLAPALVAERLDIYTTLLGLWVTHIEDTSAPGNVYIYIYVQGQHV